MSWTGRQQREIQNTTIQQPTDRRIAIKETDRLLDEEPARCVIVVSLQRERNVMHVTSGSMPKRMGTPTYPSPRLTYKACLPSR